MALHATTGQTQQTAAERPAEIPNAPGVDFNSAATVENAPGRLSFKGLMNRFNAGAGVTPEIEKYLKEIKDAVQREIPNIQLVNLPEPVATHAFIAQDRDGTRFAFLILFADAIGSRPANNLPTSRYVQQAFAALRAQYPGAHMMAAPIIYNVELPRSRMMANSILGHLLPAIDPTVGGTGVPVLSAAGEFAIDLSLDAAKSFESMHSPHEVRPAADLGFTMALRNPRPRNQGGYGFNQEVDTQMPFMSVTAKVEIIGPQRDPRSNALRYVPIIRTTSMSSELPILGSAFLGLVGAADYWITKGLWKNAFRRFDKNAPNLGHLFPNPDQSKANELWTISNNMELETVISQQFTDPYLVLDVQEGHDRLPGLASFADPVNGRANLMRAASQFFGSEPPAGLSVCAPLATTYEGFYGDPTGRLLDSRNITYLDQVARQGVLDSTTMSALTNYDSDPMRRANVISALTQSFVPAYETTLVMLDGQFMAWVASALKVAGMKIADPQGVSGYVQLTSGFGNFANYAGFGGVATSPGGFPTTRSGLYG